MRLGKLDEIREAKRLTTVVILSPSNIAYYLGLECEGCALIYSDSTPTLLVPLLDYWRYHDLLSGSLDVKPVLRYSIEGVEAPNLVRMRLLDAVSKFSKGRVGLDLGDQPTSTYRSLRSRLKGRRIVDVSSLVWSHRMVKDEKETGEMVNALSISERALEKSLGDLREGVEDFEIAGFFEFHARRLGGDGFSFPSIVGVDENSANPHAKLRGLRLSSGSVVVIDVGVKKNCYCSDLTRTLWIGEDEGKRRVLEALIEALEEAVDAAKPWASAGEPDRAARRVLSRHGLSKYFIHSVGHGIGVDVHEPPRLAPDETQELKPGMVVTIEPGVYIRGRYGMRVEQMVLIGKRKARVLNKLPTRLGV